MDSQNETATLNIESSETAALPLKTRTSSIKRGESTADKEASQRLVSDSVEVTIIDAAQRPDSIVIHGIADESHPNPGDSQHVEYVVIVNFDDRYLKTFPGVLRFLQVVSSQTHHYCKVLVKVLDIYMKLHQIMRLNYFINATMACFFTIEGICSLNIVDFLNIHGFEITVHR